MSRASIIRTGSQVAGVIASDDGTDLRFYAVQSKFRSLEGQRFPSREAAQHAAELVEIALSKRRSAITYLRRTQGGK